MYSYFNPEGALVHKPTLYCLELLGKELKGNYADYNMNKEEADAMYKFFRMLPRVPSFSSEIVKSLSGSIVSGDNILNDKESQDKFATDVLNGMIDGILELFNIATDYEFESHVSNFPRFKAD